MTVETSTLANGIRVITDTMTDVATVSLGMWVGTGSRSETKEVGGISHVLEHMAFKGTTSRTAREICETLDNVGGILNAYTSHEETAYYAKVLKEDAPLATELLSDILQNSTFPKEELEKEKTVIIQEIGMHYDNPEDHVFEIFQDKAFMDNPLGRSISGTAANVKSFTRDILKQHISQEYFPSRMVFSAAGNITHKQNLALVEKYFTFSSGKENKTSKSNQNPQPNPILPAVYTGGDTRQKRPIEQAQILMGFKGFSHQEEQRYPLTLMSIILGGGTSSRLYQEIREKRGLVYSTYAFANSYQDTGLLTIYAGTGENHTPELLPVIISEIARLTHAKVTDEELKRAKAQVKAHILMSKESTSARCDKNARNLLTYNRYIPMEEIVDRIESVTALDINKVAKEVLTGKPTFATLGAIDKVASYDDICDQLRVALL